MKQFLIPWLVVAFTLPAFSQNCGLEDTLLINPSSMHNFTFEVFDAVNDNLADTAQGVCGIEISFVHQYSEDMELWLVSPAGDTVQLMGPNTDDPLAFTFFAKWNITFVPCTATAFPDSGYVAQWDNNQPNNFINGGQYSGSYYPFDGCLEGFNSGPVNGTWTILVNNDPSNNGGAILDFRLIFCDDAGILCCFADAGSLASYPDMLVCQGDSSLIISPSPVYFTIPPDTLEYGYTYLIGEDGILSTYDSLPDLTAFPPGNYQLCGLSYKLLDRDSFPLPDGVLTLNSLRINLNSPVPLFCGEVSADCIDITIAAPPAPVNLIQTICEGDTLMVGDSLFTSSGLYSLSLLTLAGCDSIINLDLTVMPIEETFLTNTICEGDSVVVGTSVYYLSGSYTDTLSTAFFCDSIVYLELTVLAPIEVSLSEIICAGDAVMVGDSSFTETGIYQVTLISAQNCDSIVNLNLTVLEPNALIAQPDTINCFNNGIMLDGSASSPSAVISYEWSDISGNVLGNNPSLMTGSGGTFILRVEQTLGLTTCSDADTVTVVENLTVPIADAGNGDTLDCEKPELLIGSANTSQGTAITYLWETDTGHFLSDSSALMVNVDAPGLYSLIVSDTLNGCVDTSLVAIAIDTIAPLADAGFDAELNCDAPSLILDGNNSSNGPQFEYSWSSLSGIIPQNAGSLMPVVEIPDTYQLIVNNSINSCSDTSLVVVSIDTLLPQLFISPPPMLNCALRTLQLDGDASAGGAPFELHWNVYNGGNIVAFDDTLDPEIDAGGIYELVVRNLDNGCRDSLAVTVIDTINTVAADPGPGGELNCLADTIVLDGGVSSMGPDIIFGWSTADGHFAGDSLGAVSLVDQPGTYRLVVRDTFTFCADTAFVTVTIDTFPPVAEAGNGFELNCSVSQGTLDGGNSSAGAGIEYLWTGPCILTDPTAALIDVDCPGIYFFRVLDINNACTSLDSVVVTQNEEDPLADAGALATLNCAVESLVLDGTGSSQGDSLSYQWFGPGIVEGDTSLTPTIGQAGMYSLVVTNNNSLCTDTATVLISADTIPPVADPGSGGVLNCGTSELVLDAFNSTSGPDILYSWSTTAGHFVGDSVSVTATIDAWGTYRLIVKDTSNFCVDTAFVAVTIDTLPPIADAGNGFELNCSISQGSLDGGNSSAGAGIEYLWTGPCILTDPTATIIDVDCAGTYFLRVLNTNNACFSLDSVVVSLDEELPIADAGPPGQISCTNAVIMLDASGSSQGDSLTYQWLGPGIIDGDTTLVPTVNLSGQYSLVVTNILNNCTAMASVQVSVDTIAPIADAGPAGIINCNNPTVVIGGTATSTGPSISYQWFSNEGNIVGAFNMLTATADTTGVYVFIVTDTLNGCADTSFVAVINDLEPPVADAGSDRELNCSTFSVLLDGSDSASGSNISYQWGGPCLNTAADSSIVEVDCPGIFTLTVTDLDNGCSNTGSVEVSQDISLPLATIVGDTAFIFCETGTVVLDGSGSSAGSVQWLFDGVPTGETSLNFAVDEPGLYTLVVTNVALNCSDSADIVVIMDCELQISIAAADTISCEAESVVLDAGASTSGPQISYQWTTEEPTCIVSGANTPFLEVSCAGNYTLVITNNAVQLSDTLSIFVPGDTLSPQADAGPPDTITCTNPMVVLDGSNSSAGARMSYLWTDLNTGDTIGVNIIETVAAPGVYVLEVSDAGNGCKAVDLVVITEIIGVPDIHFGSTVIPCMQDTFRLQAFVDPESQDYLYAWEGPDIIADGDSLGLLIGATGQYAITVTNTINNCVVSDSVIVTQQDCVPCIEVFPGDSLTCLVDSVMLTAQFCEECTGCTILWTTTDGIILSGENSLSPIVGAAGIYTFTAIDTLGFPSSLDVEVVDNSIPPTADAGPDGILNCALFEINLGGENTSTGVAYSYQWTSQNGSEITPDSFPFATVSEADIYFLEVINKLSGCRSSDTIVVGLDTVPPLADAGPVQTLSCSQQSASLDGSASDFGPGIIYQWVSDQNPNISGADTPNPLVDIPGAYVLTVTDTLTGCFAIDSVTVDQSGDLPVIPPIPDEVLNCFDTTITLMGSIPDTIGFSFRWCAFDDNNDILFCLDSFDLSVNSAGLYGFEVTDNSNGCSNLELVQVTEDFVLPFVDAGLPDTLLCTEPSLQLAGTAGPDTLSLSFQWLAANNSVIDGDTTLNPLIFSADTYTLISINNENQCIDSASVVIVLDDDAPEAFAGMDRLLSCAAPALELDGEGLTASGTVAFSWTSPDGHIVGDSSIANPLIDQVGTYILTVTDPQNGCTVTDEVVADSNFLMPKAMLSDSTNPTLSCIVDTLLLDAGSSTSANGAMLNYTWSVAGAGNIIGDTSSPVVMADEVGVYQIMVTDSFNGCRDTLDFQIGGDFQQPNVAISVAPPLSCSRTQVELNAEGSSSGTGFINLWNDESGNILADTSLTPAVVAIGEYTLTITNLINGCESSGSVEVGIDTIPPLAAIADPDILDCIVREVSLDGSASSQSNEITFSWSANPGELLSGQEAVEAIAGAPGIYSLLVTNSSNGCSDTASVEVLESSMPISAVFFTLNRPGCELGNDGLLLIDSVGGGTGPFTYALNSDFFSSINTFRNLTPGDYLLRVQDSNGCELEVSVNIPPPEEFLVDLGVDISIQLGDSVRLEALINTDDYLSLMWSPPEEFDDPGNPVQTVKPLETTVYSVTVTGENGCVATDWIRVTLIKPRPVFIPNIFSPNGDGNNDIFMIYAGKQVVEINSFMIFDRWGNLVYDKKQFQPNDPTYGWDGIYNGRPMNPAVFVFFAEVRFLDGRVEMIKGDVTLIR